MIVVWYNTIRSREQRNKRRANTMMKQEFEDRIGYEVNGEVYDRIEALYMAQDADKDAFVKKIKRDDTVRKVQDGLIKELTAKLNTVTRWAKNRKAQADETYSRYSSTNEGDGRKTYESAQNRLVEGSREYYAYNNYLMSLTESVEANRVLEILQN